MEADVLKLNKASQLSQKIKIFYLVWHLENFKQSNTNDVLLKGSNDDTIFGIKTKYFQREDIVDLIFDF